MSVPLKDIILYAVTLFVFLSVFLLVQHEIRAAWQLRRGIDKETKYPGIQSLREMFLKQPEMSRPVVPVKPPLAGVSVPRTGGITFADHKPEAIIHEINEKELEFAREKEAAKEEVGEKEVEIEEKELELTEQDQKEEEQQFPKEQKGLLMCNGSRVDSEIIYWKVVPGDRTYESPITPHHADHHDKYLTFEYDAGGWNNVRMGMECLLVIAHATGRTLVVPPQQHLYLLGVNHQDKGDEKPHDEMGFEDFFDLGLLRSHQGLHIMHMEEFLAKEGVSGGLHGELPPHNSSEAWGAGLWHYLKKVSLWFHCCFVFDPNCLMS